MNDPTDCLHTDDGPEPGDHCCDCGAPLTKENMMQRYVGNVGDPPAGPWEADDRAGIVELVCAECFVAPSGELLNE